MQKRMKQMKTTMNLNDKIINETIRLSGIKKRKEIVHIALREFNRKLKRARLIKLAGAGLIEDAYNIEKIRDLSNDRNGFN
jgi:Arc/MetJ family transcription regulator